MAEKISPIERVIDEKEAEEETEEKFLEGRFLWEW